MYRSIKKQVPTKYLQCWAKLTVIMKVTSITFSKIKTPNMLRKSYCLKLRKKAKTHSHLKLTFILKVPPRVVILSQQRRNWNKKLILWNGNALRNSSSQRNVSKKLRYSSIFQKTQVSSLKAQLAWMTWWTLFVTDKSLYCKKWSQVYNN